MIAGIDLAIVIAAALAGSAAIGWILHWLWVVLTRAPRTETAQIADLTERLYAAETARDEAARARAEAENRMAAREAELLQEMRDLSAGMEQRLERREAEMARALREAESEARTAWEGLASARQRIGELERALAERTGRPD